MQKGSIMNTKINWTLVGMIMAWLVTLASFVWTVAVKDSNYSLKIAHIEKELEDLDSRLDIAETFRMDIRADLAEIKTDLLWIRQQLQENN